MEFCQLDEPNDSPSTTLAVLESTNLPPEMDLAAAPYPYQLQGIKWLYDRTNALLADAPGLGKSAQSLIAARLLLRDCKIATILIVCPKSLFTTWQTEAAKWWPDLKLIRPSGNRRKYLLKKVPAKLVNYDSLAREDIEWLQGVPWHDLIICDELHRAKNAATACARAVKVLRGLRRWGLTGTPLENKIGDLASVFDFVAPNPIEHDTTITQVIARPPYMVRIKQRTTQLISDTIRTSTNTGARIAAAPFILRRQAEEVLDQLPEKIEQDVPISLGSQQRATYERAEQEGVMRLNEAGDEITIAHVFQLIARLRQICNFDPVTGQSAKLERVISEMEEIVSSGKKALLFSQFVGEWGLRTIAGYTQQFGPLQMHGGLDEPTRDATVRRFISDDSCKLLLLNYRVGGVGLNLQAASYVFLFDRWWNPAVEEQAAHRAHRIGQLNRVFVRRFVCVNTIEERIIRKLAEKRKLFKEVIDDDRAPANTGLTEADLFSLFNIKVRPKRAKAPPPTPTTESASEFVSIDT